MQDGMCADVRRRALTAARVCAGVGYAAVGAGVVLFQGVVGVLAPLIAVVRQDRRMPRYNVERVRSQVRAAAQAARAAGVWRRGKARR